MCDRWRANTDNGVLRTVRLLRPAGHTERQGCYHSDQPNKHKSKANKMVTKITELDHMGQRGRSGREDGVHKIPKQVGQDTREPGVLQEHHG